MAGNHDRDTRLVGSLKATFAGPIRPIAIKVAVNGNIDGRASIACDPEASIAIPTAPGEIVDAISVRWNFYADTSAAQFLESPIAFPAAAAIRGVRRMCVRGNFDGCANLTGLPIAAVTLPTVSIGIVHRVT